MLDRGEVDVIVTPLINTEVALIEGALDSAVHMNGVMDTYLLYHYLHEEHAQMVPVVEAVLKEMLVEGRVSEIRAEVFERVRARAAQGR